MLVGVVAAVAVAAPVEARPDHGALSVEVVRAGPST